MEQHKSKMDLFISWCLQQISFLLYDKRISTISNDGSALWERKHMLVLI